MIRSMTGYGRAQKSGGGFAVTVELRSVNHRYLDINARMPRTYIYMEEQVKARIQKAISRGKVDVFTTIEPESGDMAVDVKLNRTAADAYIAALTELKDDCGVEGRIDLMQLARLPEVLTVGKPEPDEDQLLRTVLEAVDEALDGYIKMSTAEGENLKADILGRTVAIEEAVSRVEMRGEDTVNAYTERLYARMKEALDRLGADVDQARILTEAAVFADKTANAEETVRLRSHIGQMRDMLGEGGQIGRRLDFLLQEFNREANTIGSKASDLETSRIVVDIKSEIEKIREQVQNIE